ncbi:hypothetical protein, partial [Algoriphagus sp.]|uniref:hypothetical protein n=1 Tax=Algoriphagus sp. TaxID=1872435 RepID=UPI0027309E86
MVIVLNFESDKLNELLKKVSLNITTVRETVLKFRVSFLGEAYPFCCILGLPQLQITADEKYT